MNKRDLIIFYKKKTELFLIALIAILYIIRTIIPVLKYPFLVLFLIMGVYIVADKSSGLFARLKSSKKILITTFLLFLYLLLACLFSDKIYLLVVKDIVNIIIIAAIMLMLLILLQDKDDLKTFFDYFLYLILASAFIISIQRIYIYFYISSYTNEILIKNTPQVDSNFVLLPVFFGMVTCLYFLSGNISRFKVFLLNVLLFICSINILLSGSRRGFVLFLIICLVFVSIQVWGALDKKNIVRKLFINTAWFFYSFLIFIVLLFFLFSHTSVYYKNILLEDLNVKNIAFTKIQLTESVFRYYNMVKRESSFDYVYRKIWNPVFDPKDPEAGSGNGNYKIVNNLTGKNIEIVPNGTKGYLLDKDCIGDSSLTHAYFFQLIDTRNVEKGDSLIASVYCFVSDDFNGTAAAFRAIGALNGNPDAFYDLNEKGRWKKMIMPIDCNNGELRTYLYMNKGGVGNFSTLEGYVIFAYPEFVRINRNTGRSSSNDIETSGSKHGKYFPSIMHSSRNTFNAHMFAFPYYNIITSVKTDIDKDLLRNWIAKIISEDTVYHGYKADLSVSGGVDNFGEGRASRWKFAVNIFAKEYNWQKKIFGGGFNFLNWYGYYFMKDKTASDYPHNPFLHVLLYSGILGLSIYLFFLFNVFYYYIKHFRKYSLFFIFFLITFYFTFFSGGCPFDPPVMGYFVILPFLIQSIYKKV